MTIARADFDTAGDVLARPHDNCYWLLAARVLAGEHPGTQERVHAIEAAGIGHFIDLTEARNPLSDYRPLHASHEHYTIADFGIPTVAGMRRTLDAIDAALAAGGNVYLHCQAGIGRTGTVAGCLLVEHGFEPAEAIALLQRKWRACAKSAFVSRTPETQAQRAFIAAWRRARSP